MVERDIVKIILLCKLVITSLSSFICFDITLSYLFISHLILLYQILFKVRVSILHILRHDESIVLTKVFHQIFLKISIFNQLLRSLITSKVSNKLFFKIIRNDRSIINVSIMRSCKVPHQIFFKIIIGHKFFRMNISTKVSD